MSLNALNAVQAALPAVLRTHALHVKLDTILILIYVLNAQQAALPAAMLVLAQVVQMVTISILFAYPVLIAYARHAMVAHALNAR